MAPWEIRLCGRAAVSNSDGLTSAALPGRQGQLLLAYLVCHRTRACPRYELEDVLWPKDAPASSDSALSALLSKLRRALGADALAGRAELRLTLPEPLWVDIEALADAVEVAVQALDERRWEDAAERGPRRARASAPSRSWPSATGRGCATAAARSRACGCARWRRSARPGCGSAAASSTPPSTPRAPRSGWRRSASPRTGC